jgi:hypothetical protein
MGEPAVPLDAGVEEFLAFIRGPPPSRSQVRWARFRNAAVGGVLLTSAGLLFDLPSWAARALAVAGLGSLLAVVGCGLAAWRLCQREGVEAHGFERHA